MIRAHSLNRRLAVFALLLLSIIAALGGAAFWGLDHFNAATRDVRDRWLPNTRLLGDLNNYTSDYRAAEADCLIGADTEGLAPDCGDRTKLGAQVAEARRAFERIRHDPEETAGYRAFADAWDAYLPLAGEVAALAAGGRRGEAARLYAGPSRAVYARASDSLELLTNANVARAQAANERAGAAFRETAWLLAGMVAAATCVLGAGIWHARRTIARPLLGLALTMRRLAANDTAVDVPHQRRRDEIGEMARAVTVFRANAVDLAQGQHGLARQAAMLEEKLAHEQRLARMQRDFVSTFAHEFRTPLTLIDGNAQRIASLAADRAIAAIEDRAGRIRLAVRRIVALIDTVINSARVLDGEPALFFHPEPTELGPLLDEVCGLHQELSPDARIELRAEDVRASADPQLLFQAVSNLLSNAIKYSPGQALVEVTLRGDGGFAAIDVRDHGLGIAEADLPRVFDPYYRGRNVAGLVGAGIGLHFVQVVARLHGGRAIVESREGEGAWFTLELPAGAAPA